MSSTRMAKCTLLGAEKDIMKHHAQSVLRDSVEKDTTDKKIRMFTPKGLHDSFCLELLRSKEKHRRLNTVTSLIKIASLRKRRRLFVKRNSKWFGKQIVAIPQKSAHRSKKVVSVQWSKRQEKVRIPQSTSATQ